MTTAEAAYLRNIVWAIHCPVCGGKAAKQVQSPTHVEPVYACGTEGCPFNWEDGERAWTLGLRS